MFDLQILVLCLIFHHRRVGEALFDVLYTGRDMDDGCCRVGRALVGGLRFALCRSRSVSVIDIAIRVRGGSAQGSSSRWIESRWYCLSRSEVAGSTPPGDILEDAACRNGEIACCSGQHRFGFARHAIHALRFADDDDDVAGLEGIVGARADSGRAVRVLDSQERH